MAETPTSYKDPFWTQLASATEQKLDLPPGLLVGVLTRGERSNADQVSEAGAKTPFQIIPATRKAAIDKYGIDPYLSPENAAEVAGKLLKDSLDRNKGDAAAAVGEYHGGIDRVELGHEDQGLRQARDRRAARRCAGSARRGRSRRRAGGRRPEHVREALGRRQRAAAAPGGEHPAGLPVRPDGARGQAPVRGT
jgi:hypothetical protein